MHTAEHMCASRPTCVHCVPFASLLSTYIISGDVLVPARCLNCIGHEAEDCSNPEQQGETTEHLFAELNPLWGGWRRM